MRAGKALLLTIRSLVETDGGQNNLPSKPREYMEDAPGRNVSNKGREQWNEIELTEVVFLGEQRTIQTLPPSDFLQSRRTKDGRPRAVDLVSSKGSRLYHSQKGVLNPHTYGLPDTVREWIRSHSSLAGRIPSVQYIRSRAHNLLSPSV